MAGSFNLTTASVAVVLLDIEGTTTPISFVHDVLFPYARARVSDYLEETARADDEIRHVLADLRSEHAASGVQLSAGRPTPEARSGELAAGSRQLEADIVSYVHWLMDRDRKSGPLKRLQGRIWERGYASGELKGEVYPEVREAFERWTAGGLRLAIFSSGSVLAQQLLFANSTAGDLSPFLSAYFDTAVGAKGEAASYARIVAALNVSASRVLFISDVVAELDAARVAGLQTMLCARAPAPLPEPASHTVVEAFDSLTV